MKKFRNYLNVGGGENTQRMQNDNVKVSKWVSKRSKHSPGQMLQVPSSHKYTPSHSSTNKTLNEDMFNAKDSNTSEMSNYDRADIEAQLRDKFYN